MKPRTVALSILTLLLTVGPADAQVAGETHRTTTQPTAAVRDAEGRSDLRITIWYPAAEGSPAEPLVIGPPGTPFFEVGSIAPNAPFAADPPVGRRPVILLSHGYGGTARIMGWFGTAMAEAGYVVISVDHPGNNAIDEMTIAGATLWWERAEDLKHALDAVSEDEVLGHRIDPERVGAAGFSAGGFTALVLGGARVDRERFTAFCRANPDDGVCRPQEEFAFTQADVDRTLQDPRVAAIEATASDDHSLPSTRAVFAMAPALVQAIDPGSFEAMVPPVWLLAGDADGVVPVATNALVAAEHIPDARVELLPGIGHYAFLSTCTAVAVEDAAALCAQAHRQPEVHAAAIEQARAFFARHLGSPN